MKIFTTPSRIMITCGKRLSPYLEQEMVELGFSPVRTFATGVELQGTLNDCIRLNLNLRCASQVLYSVKDFSAKSPEEVYETVLALPWEEMIPQDGYFSVTSVVNHFSVNNSLFMNVKVKDAIADRMRHKTGRRPDSGSELNCTVIHLFWKENWAEVFVDSSGETLAKHGYRKMPGKAPMLESLAAATIMATQWDKVSPFINPMCGSSTVAIEAALLATHRRPGLFRNNYAFMHLIGYDAAVYARERRRLEEQIKEVPGLIVTATDISMEAIRISKMNAEAAGVETLIQFAVGDFEATPIPAPIPGKTGVIYFNPEYGERLGQASELEGTYARMGDFMKKKCKGLMGYIFTGNLDLAKKIGLRAKRRLEFYTAKIDSRLLEYELYEGTKR
ncbi:MAG: class I SAM-dependent RNA methyltransferase [Deltaproteobacteria bacterium]|nr:class I SAM-dependent RNA methyltransferase [Deltaproteobacteria bacterium]